MTTIRISAAGSCAPTLALGRRGENLATEIRFDFSAWAEEFGEGRVELYARRCGDENAYPVIVTVEGQEAVWTLTATDTHVVGYGTAEFVWVAGETVVKSVVFGTFVEPDIGQPTDTPPEPYESWLDTLTELAADTEAAAQRAETAEAASESAQTAAETAQGKAEVAQNAAETAQGKAEDAQGAAETAQGKAEDAQTAAETAQGLAETAQSAAESAQTAAETAQDKAEDAQAAAEAAQAAAEAVLESIPEDYTELTEEVASIELTGTAEGTEIAAFDDALARPLRSLSVSFSPKQDGSGTPSLDNLRPITGWTGMTIYHSSEDVSDPDELVLDWNSVAGVVSGGKVTYSGNGTWTILRMWDGATTNADGALQRYSTGAVNNWSGNITNNYVYFSANGSNTGVIEDSDICNMYKHGSVSGGADHVVNVYRASANSRISLRDTSITGWTEATTNSGLAAAVKAYFADLYAQGIQFQCVWKLTTPVEHQITTEELVALLGKNRYWASGIDSIRVEYAEVTTTAVDAIRAGTFSYAGKNVAIIGDSISTNGNWSTSNPLGNVPEFIAQEGDQGVELSAYVTYYDVGTTIGGYTITEADVGNEITFRPSMRDVLNHVAIGKPRNNNAAATATWWEVAAATLGFNPIPVAWSGSSITSHEESATEDGHYIYKCSYSWHESQIRKCGIRIPGTMDRIAPDMVIIYRGANDLTHTPYSRITDYLDSYPTSYPTEDTYDDSGTTRYDYAKGMRLLINKLRTAYPQTKIVLCTMNYFRRLGSSKWTTNGTDNWQKYNDMIRRLAEYEGCDLIDFAKDGLSWANAKYGYYNEGTSDSANWTHPNTKGHAVLGARALRDLLNINDKPVVG